MKNLLKVCAYCMIAITMFSCDDAENVKIEVAIMSDKQEIIADGSDQLVLRMETQNKEDVTAGGVFYVNSQEISGNTFTTLEAGIISCYAEYNGVRTNTIKVTVKEQPIFKKNIIVENYTATWCGFCPRVHDAIIDAVSSNDRVIPIAVHIYSDPFMFASYSVLTAEFGIEGWPTAMIDRDYKWPYPENEEGLEEALDYNSALGLAITSTLNDNQLSVDAKVKFGKDLSGDFKIVVCLVEDNLIYDQENGYDDGRGNPIPDYEHNGVLRAYGTDLLGDDIPSGQAVKDNEYVKSVSFDLSSYSSSNCKIVAFVVKNDQVINVRSAVANTSVTYEEL